MGGMQGTESVCVSVCEDEERDEGVWRKMKMSGREGRGG